MNAPIDFKSNGSESNSKVLIDFNDKLGLK